MSVPILDDVLDEGSEHFLLRLSNPQGAYVKTGHGELHGLITNEDPLQRMWLARFGRTQLGGEVLTRVLGADADFGRVLAGVAVSLSDGEGAFDNPGVDVGNAGHLSSTLTALSPYVRVNLTERLSAWGLAGAGTGEMSIRFDDEAMPGVSTGLSMRMGAAGARGVLLSQDGSGVMDLALKADALFVRTPRREGRRVHRHRGRREPPAPAAQGWAKVLSAEQRDAASFAGAGRSPRRRGTPRPVRAWSWAARWPSAAPSGCPWRPAQGVWSAHADSDYQEWGASATVHYDPGEPGKGLSLSLAAHDRLRRQRHGAAVGCGRSARAGSGRRPVRAGRPWARPA